jgi:hypothetical protein
VDSFFAKSSERSGVVALRAVGLGVLLWFAASAGIAQTLDESAIIRGVDAAVKTRIDGIAAYTDTEHYRVFRGKDETHPVAEMVVKTAYRPDSGKSYDILSESGSAIISKFLLKPILETEKAINDPAKVSASWIVSANYEMKLKSGSPVQQDGRDCWALAIKPKREAPNLIEGTLWVDAKDFTIVRLEGQSSKSPSFWSGPANVMRQYAKISGFAEATHARAESVGFMVGRTVITIEYEGYQIQTR